jgi:ABC-type microcin C transport system duplicated ATPase subunit YejF
MRLLPKDTASITKGSIRLGGRELTGLDDRQMRKVRGREIAMILQDPQTSLNPAFRIGDQIVEALRLHRKPESGGYLQMAIDALRKVRVAALEMRVHAYRARRAFGRRLPPLLKPARSRLPGSVAGIPSAGLFFIYNGCCYYRKQ